MKILVSVDLEGITGLKSYYQLHSKKENDLKQIQNLTLKEIDNVVKACWDGGASKVYVVDGHGSGGNVDGSELKNKTIMVPKILPYRMMTNIDKKMDAVLFIGYHGRAGIKKSFIAHTNSSKFVNEVRVNGIPVGELELNALLAKQFKTKVIFASGTDVGMKEIEKVIPGIKTATVLESIDFFRAKSLPIDEVYSKIRRQIKSAIKNLDEVEFIASPSKPIVMEVDFKGRYPKNRFKKLEYFNNRHSVRFTEKDFKIAYRNYGRYLRAAIRNMVLD